MSQFVWFDKCLHTWRKKKRTKRNVKGIFFYVLLNSCADGVGVRVNFCQIKKKDKKTLQTNTCLMDMDTVRWYTQYTQYPSTHLCIESVKRNYTFALPNNNNNKLCKVQTYGNNFLLNVLPHFIWAKPKVICVGYFPRAKHGNTWSYILVILGAI